MSKTIKYTGSQIRWSELAVTGKQSVWQPGQSDQRSDAEASLLLGTGQFAEVLTVADLPLPSLVSGAGTLSISATGGTATGATLTAVLGAGWSVTGYQWTRDGVDIAGATASTYVLTGADGGRSIGCRGVGAAYTASITTAASSYPAGQLYLDAQPIYIDGANLALV